MTTESDSKALSQARYSRFAQGYVTSKTHARGAELERLIEIAQPRPEWNVLDVATGGGHTALKFAPFVAQVTATDITPRMLEQAEAFITGQGIKNVTFKLADAEDLPFEDGIFDLVTCRVAAHHFPDPARFVSESARVLRSGGLLLVQDHTLPEDAEAGRYVDDFERLRDPSHNRAFRPSEWAAMLESAGFKVEHSEQVVKRHGFVAWAERQGCTPETVGQLVALMEQAPPAVRAWMQPRDWGTPQASFANDHLIIAGRKG
jgi:ubiquinone/menaquinone biosynthesis C-methylase UbiE